MPERLITREFLVLGLSTMCFFASMGASNPVLPKFVVDELGGSGSAAGFVVGSFAISSLLTRTWFGRLGDRRGARRLMVIGCAVGALGMAGLAVSSTMFVAVVARLVTGAGQAAVMTGSTVLAIDLAPDFRRGEAASYILVAFHLGLGLGPLIGEGVLAFSSYDVVWLVLAALMAVGLLVALVLPHRPRDHEVPPAAWFQRAAVLPGVVQAFGIVGFVAFSFFVPLYARDLGMEEVAPVFVVASSSIVLARIVFGRTPDLIGPVRSSTIALGITVAGSVMAAWWAAPVGVYVSAAVLAGGMALQTPALISVAVDTVPAHARASAMATFTMFMDVSVALTGPVLGLVADAYGYGAMFGVGGVAACAALVLVRTRLVHHAPVVGVSA